MPFIEFTRAYAVDDGSGAEYKVGDVVELSEASCQHFVKRNVAKTVETPKPAAKKPTAKADK